MATILKLRLCSLPLFLRRVDMFTQRGGDEPDRLLQVLWKFADINEAWLSVRSSRCITTSPGYIPSVLQMISRSLMVISTLPVRMFLSLPELMPVRTATSSYVSARLKISSPIT